MEASNNKSHEPGSGDGAMNGLPDPTEDPSGCIPSDSPPADHPLPNPSESGDQEEDETPPPPPSLTDHLNKSLLSSFLDRLNNPNNMSSSFPVVDRINTSDDPETALEVPAEQQDFS